jgi:hypothetical protein
MSLLLARLLAGYRLQNSVTAHRHSRNRRTAGYERRILRGCDFHVAPEGCGDSPALSVGLALIAPPGAPLPGKESSAPKPELRFLLMQPHPGSLLQTDTPSPPGDIPTACSVVS